MNGAAFDLVLLDLVLSERKSLGLFRRLRATASTRAAVIIVVAAPGSEGALGAALDCGADDFLAKPILFDLLPARLTLAERMARERREREEAEEEREHLQTQVRHSQKLESLGALSGGIAHDFNNLLMGVIGNTQLAISEVPEASPVHGYLRQIQQAALRAAELTHQLMAYSGKGKYTVESVDLSRLVEQTQELLHSAVHPGARLHYDLPAGLPLMSGDPAQLRQVLVNLVANASDALGEQGGAIRVATGMSRMDKAELSAAVIDEDLPEGDYVFLEVEDTGPGINARIRERVFDPFFTTKFAGRGLGLAAVLGIARGHRGTIVMHTEEGRGTTFRILFPCDKSARKATAGAGRNGPSAGGVVLVVDDEDTVRTVTSMTLEKNGMKVITACNGREGLERYRQNPEGIALVILDLTMPEMGGEETFVRMQEVRPDVKVILTSGYSESDVMDRFRSAGLIGFLHKPYMPGDLMGMVQRALD